MNHPHELQAAAMARAGELPDGEQLRECINSGQVSAAQVVAHAENGEVTTGWPAGLLQDDSRQLSKALSRNPNARALAREAVAHQEAGELPPLPEPLEIEWPSLHQHALGCGVEDRNIHDRYEAAEYGWQDGVDRAAGCVPDEIYDAEQMLDYARAALAAERAEVARLRGAGERLVSATNYRQGMLTSSHANDDRMTFANDTYWQAFDEFRIALAAGENHD